MQARIPLALILTMLAVLVLPGAAMAQSTRTWVSGVGDDANPCSRTAPCKTFAGAISKTAVSGEISVLDPGGYGAVTIVKSISIVAEGVEGGILVSGTNGIVVNGAGIEVSLRGLTLEGAGTGLNGISFVNGGDLHVENCVVHGFSQAGIAMASNSPGRIHIRNASIYQNGLGLNIQSNGAVANVRLEDSTLENNASGNIQLNGSGAVVLLSNDSILGSVPGIAATGGATVKSFGNNRITNGGVINQVTPLQ